MKLFFIQKTVYGNTLFYPVEGTLAASICKVAGRKTFTMKELKTLSEGGFEIEINAPVFGLN
jgi:hypothetical protein